MEFSTKVGRPETIKTDAIVVGVHADGELTPTAKALDAASDGAIKAAVKSGDMTGKRGTQLLLRGLSGVAAPRVLLLGLGGSCALAVSAILFFSRRGSIPPQTITALPFVAGILDAGGNLLYLIPIQYIRLDIARSHLFNVPGHNGVSGLRRPT